MYDLVFDVAFSSRILPNIVIAILNSKLSTQAQSRAATENASTGFDYRQASGQVFTRQCDMSVSSKISVECGTVDNVVTEIHFIHSLDLLVYISKKVNIYIN